MRLIDCAAAFGVDVHICSCKNPDLAESSNCGIAGPTTTQAVEQNAPLFSNRRA